MKYCTFCRPSRYKLIVKAKLKIEKLLRSKVVNRFEVLVGFINTSYLTDSYINFTLKMESVSKNTIFDLKMMVKSGVEKFILKSLHAGR